MDTRNYTLASFPIWLVRDGYWSFRCHYRSFINYFLLLKYLYKAVVVVNYASVFYIKDRDKQELEKFVF